MSETVGQRMERADELLRDALKYLEGENNAFAKQLRKEIMAFLDIEQPKKQRRAR